MPRHRKPVPKLTDEQAQLATEYFDDIFKLSSYWNRQGTILNLEECYDEAVTSLMVAVRKFDPTLNVKFSTYFYTLMERNIYRALRDKKAPMRVGNLSKVSLSAELRFGKEKNVTLENTFGVEDSYDVLNEQQLESLFYLLPEREKYCIVEQFLKGRKQSDIAKDLGVSQVSVSRFVKAALITLKKVLKKEAAY